MEFRLGWRSRFERQGQARAVRADDAAAPARPVPRRAGGCRRGGLPRRREGHGRHEGDSASTASRCRESSSAPTARTGRPRKSLGLGGPITHGVAFEGNAPFDDRYRGLAVIELGTIPGGYGWIFPKGDHVNVGVGGWEAEGPRLRGAPRGALRGGTAIDVDTLESVRGPPAATPPRRVRPRAWTGRCSSATRQGSSTR